MRKTLLLAIAWIGLFGLTLGIRTLAAGSDSEIKPKDGLANEALQALMDSRPRRSALVLYSPSKESASFDAQLRTFMMGHDAALRRCRAVVMQPSTRGKEFFELSFAVRTIDLSTRIRLENVAFERSTIEVTPEDERCLVDAFASFELEADGPPSIDKLFFQFCFGSLKK